MSDSDKSKRLPAEYEPKVIKGLDELLKLHESLTVGGGDLIVDKDGNKCLVLHVDKLWNSYPNLVVRCRDGRVLAMSSLKFPVTWEV